MTMQIARPCVAVFIASLYAAPTAYAQAPTAEVLFAQGKEALAAGDLDTACTRFRASDKLDPAVGTKANLGECEARRGKIVSALEAFREVLEKLPAGDSRAGAVKQRIKSLEARMPQLVLTLATSAPKDTTVREGHTTIGMTDTFGVPLPLDPGEHHLTVLAPGHRTKSLDVTLVEGKTETIEVEPGEIKPKAPLAETPKEPNESPSPGPWIVGGVGIAALIAGAVTGALVIQADNTFKNECHPTTRSCSSTNGTAAVTTVQTLGPATTALLVVGGAGLAVGGIWLGVRASATSSARIGIGPIVGGAGWRVEGSW